ncbi:MAG: hypothetical protein A2315_08370 [Ignavibacteria bacterium RIFOXYB2_FULL_35_12]|nr:MAG: hypothetical protein A2058_08470 [Ignavibacteria bacterium GWA2_36_19]OGU59892.1 MAG: hypothetical protein A2X60_14365 [Ignavibacteria bacterium GWF2_35_20]OGU89289.1 MAG: hypothetical protein A2492_10455 [Ignavibacteria bacterium RIFOXYC12_FULL_35_11]OGU90705.1 MAG: hypothetical protein A3K31_15075 [Ignavibacteria bacterium RIFOXYA12_FULL_35_25]OGV00214.1 MAG: hypothetical protein A2455_08235 [Ignavibacteria bacterium RIFOXYC2_FULL_35_16]OGV04807.1 MAG: hypothetical protein A2315_0837
MKRLFSLVWLLLFSLFLSAQDFQYLGLANKNITSLKIGEGIIAVGTNYNGVYWHQLYNITDSTWNKIDIDSVNITAVYPHKSGPVGWAIGIGAEPSTDNSEFVFCSFVGGTPKPMSYGIDTNHTTVISGIDGFPDLAICGETFAIGGRKLYRRFFQDTVWHSVYECVEGGLMSLKAREESGYVYAGGGEGYTGILLIRSSDKGETWEHLYPGTYVNNLDFWGTNEQKIIVSDYFKILISKDSGTNWNTIFQNDSVVIKRIIFNLDGTRIYATANSALYIFWPTAYLLYSTDDGDNWKSFVLPFNDEIVGMDIDTDDNIYIAARMAGVYKIKKLIVNIEEFPNIQPASFELYQNYPNPFNPSTKISWQSPVTGRQGLKVFDFLGNEIATLVDEDKPAGSYEVEFEAKGLSSGIYFYKLQYEKNYLIKKMIHLK